MRARCSLIQPGRRGRGGTASIEMALVLPTLVVLLFGTIEFGVMVRAASAVNHIASEAVRSAAVGASPTLVLAHVAAISTGLDSAQLTTTCEYRTWNGDAGDWTAWQTLTATGTVNDAPRGSQIRVTVNYPHHLVMRGLFGSMLGAQEGGTIPLSATVATVRE